MSQGKIFLGIELGSTRIKAALVDGGEGYKPVASGWHDWENRLENGYWTYSLDDILSGVRDAYAKLAADYKNKTGFDLTRLDGIGVSAMMHGYLVFDKDNNLLVPFRTWRNTTTGEAAEALTKAFNFNIPQRWSVAHLYQAILNNEPHVKDVAFMTTLAGYVHWKLTGEKVLGAGDASGVFPLRAAGGNTPLRGGGDTLTYDDKMLSKFADMTGINLENIMPKILNAGENAGVLTSDGAKFLDPAGTLENGTPVCPPEGDAGTGMVATNCVKPRTCNVSAGTSIFAMVVLERPLSAVRKEIDVVTTPDGAPVAMAHYNECSALIDPWVDLFGEALNLFGFKVERGELFTTLYETAVNENETENPKISRFMRERLTEAVKELACGMKILIKDEGIKIDKIIGHGGYFKSGNAGRKIMSELLGISVTTEEISAEGGAYGMALLAAYSINADGEKLADFLEGI